ncbi:MAG TPA: SpoIIE family protein phosphatase [Acidimicrobiia bacterium]|nr:SpoIIE family protein phosphatase [Acidimicrobiia bacterium]
MGLFKRRLAPRVSTGGLLDEVRPAVPTAQTSVVEIPQHDPLHAYLLEAGGPVDLTKLALDSPAVRDLGAEKVELVVPLINQGELLGTLNLGHRLSDQPYSTDDRRLLESLAAQVAPAIRVAQLVRQQEQQAKERERIDQELRVAALIQQTLLPRDLPKLPGWAINAHYRSARAVGGDFYDFIPLAGGRLGVVIGDVTDKGVPAALVMATTRSTLRAVAPRFDSPGRVLAEVNDTLQADIPPAMFVTCFYGILDPSKGEFRYANAGHNLPYALRGSSVTELRATGMPLGLLPGMPYQEREELIEPGTTVLFTSDGIAEAHSVDGAMFGLPRLVDILTGQRQGDGIIDSILLDLDSFTSGGEQEDDVTMVVIERTSSARRSAGTFAEGDLRSLVAMSFPSVDGNERLAMDRVAEALADLDISPERLEKLKTAVAEATMNAIEHGNSGDPAKTVDVEVLGSEDRVLIRVKDHGGGREIPNPETPNLEAKLEGLQSPRGWGLFLIEQMVDEMHTMTDASHHTVELVMYRNPSPGEP